MLKTQVIAILLVYFSALHDHTLHHDHVHVESSVEIIAERQRER